MTIMRERSDMLAQPRSARLSGAAPPTSMGASDMLAQPRSARLSGAAAPHNLSVSDERSASAAAAIAAPRSTPPMSTRLEAARIEAAAAAAAARRTGTTHLELVNMDRRRSSSAASNVTLPPADLSRASSAIPSSIPSVLEGTRASELLSVLRALAHVSEQPAGDHFAARLRALLAAPDAPATVGELERAWRAHISASHDTPPPGTPVDGDEMRGRLARQSTRVGDEDNEPSVESRAGTVLLFGGVGGVGGGAVRSPAWAHSDGATAADAATPPPSEAGTPMVVAAAAAAIEGERAVVTSLEKQLAAESDRLAGVRVGKRALHSALVDADSALDATTQRAASAAASARDAMRERAELAVVTAALREALADADQSLQGALRRVSASAATGAVPSVPAGDGPHGRLPTPTGAGVANGPSAAVAQSPPSARKGGASGGTVVADGRARTSVTQAADAQLEARLATMAAKNEAMANALDAAGRELQLLQEMTPCAVFSLSALGTVVGWNRAAAEVTGWRKEEVGHRHFVECFVPEHCQERTAEALETAFSTEPADPLADEPTDPFEFELALQPPAGGTGADGLKLSARIGTRRDAHGEPLGLLCVQELSGVNEPLKTAVELQRALDDERRKLGAREVELDALQEEVGALRSQLLIALDVATSNGTVAGKLAPPDRGAGAIEPDSVTPRPADAGGGGSIVRRGVRWAAGRQLEEAVGFRKTAPPSAVSATRAHNAAIAPFTHIVGGGSSGPGASASPSAGGSTSVSAKRGGTRTGRR